MKRHPLESEFARIARTFSGNHDITVDTTTTQCNTDGVKLIRIPANADYMDKAHKDVIHGMLDHEWLHVRAERDAQERRRKDRSVVLPSQAMKTQPDSKHKQLLNVYKDIIDEQLGANDYVGVAENLEHCSDHCVKLLKTEHRKGKLSMWRQVTAGIILRGRNRDDSWLSAEAQAILDYLEPEVTDSRKGRYVEDALALVERTWDKLKALAESEPEDGEGEGEGGEGQEGDGSEGEGGGASKSKSKAKRGKGKQDGSDKAKSDGSDSGEGDEDGEGQGGGQGEGDEDQGEQDGSGSGEGDDGDSDGSDKSDGEGEQDAPGGHDEYDPSEVCAAAREACVRLIDEVEDLDDLMDVVRKDIEAAAIDDIVTNRRHIPHPKAVASDRVIKAEGGDHDGYKKLRDQVRPFVSAIRSRILTLLRVRAQSRIIPDREEGEMDEAALHRLTTGDRHVFTEEVPGQKLDCAISILRDFSGSMWSANKYVYEQQACISIAEALDQLGIPNEVISFQNDRETAVHSYRTEGELYNRFEGFTYRVYKGFNEPYKRIKTRFAHSNIGGNNVDGEAILFAARRLAQRPEQRKILIVLSDGAPAAYCDNELNFRYTIEAAQQVQASGIECFGIGIMDSTVSRIYRDHCVIRDLNQLAPELFKMLRRYIVDRGRRLHKASRAA